MTQQTKDTERRAADHRIDARMRTQPGRHYATRPTPVTPELLHWHGWRLIHETDRTLNGRAVFAGAKLEIEIWYYKHSGAIELSLNDGRVSMLVERGEVGEGPVPTAGEAAVALVEHEIKLGA